eukprot:8451796-Pyramimonas_sp.AAC.1
MKARVEAALQRHLVQGWSLARQLARDRLLRAVDSGSAPLVAQLATAWLPAGIYDQVQQHVPRRQRGRPRQRWTA